MEGSSSLQLQRSNMGGFFILRNRKIEEPPSSKNPPPHLRRSRPLRRLPSDLRTDLRCRKSKMARGSPIFETKDRRLKMGKGSSFFGSADRKWAKVLRSSEQKIEDEGVSSKKGCFFEDGRFFEEPSPFFEEHSNLSSKNPPPIFEKTIIFDLRLQRKLPFLDLRSRTLGRRWQSAPWWDKRCRKINSQNEDRPSSRAQTARQPAFWFLHRCTWVFVFLPKKRPDQFSSMPWTAKRMVVSRAKRPAQRRAQK